MTEFTYNVAVGLLYLVPKASKPDKMHANLEGKWLLDIIGYEIAPSARASLWPKEHKTQIAQHDVNEAPRGYHQRG